MNLTVMAGALMWLLLAGCETASRSLAPESVKFITPGVTTRAEMLRRFGEPTGMTSGEGRTLSVHAAARNRSREAKQCTAEQEERLHGREVTYGIGG